MSERRFHLLGLFAVLLALMAQLGVGSSVPRVDPVAGVGLLCHTGDSTDGVPLNAPVHPSDCLVCPLCIALHVPSATLVSEIATPRSQVAEIRLEAGLPPPSTAPPVPHRPPSQPRAPPIFS